MCCTIGSKHYSHKMLTCSRIAGDHKPGDALGGKYEVVEKC